MATMKMTESHPKKLSWLDAIEIKSKHSSFGLSVIGKLMMLDYSTPVFTSDSISDDIPASDDLETDNIFLFNSQESNTIRLHPMDVMNVIYSCCNTMLLQILMEKLFLCRLSIPLVFPDINRDSKLTFIMWSLRTLTSKWKNEAGKQVELSLVDIPQTYFSFLRIGKNHLHMSKSKVLNDLLNSAHQKTFFHRDCENGMSHRIDSTGTIDASWCLPTDNKVGQSHMYAVLNLRGDALQFPEQTKWLCKASNLIFLMFDLDSLKSKEYVRVCDFESTWKSKFVICLIAHSFTQLSSYRKELTELQKYIVNAKDHIFAHMQNWNKSRLLNYAELKNETEKIIDRYMINNTSKKSLEEIRETIGEFNFEIDENDQLCRISSSNARELLKPIEIIDPHLRKPELLPLQGKLWKDWGRLTKEQHRNKITENPVEIISQNKNELKLIRDKQFILVAE